MTQQITVVRLENFAYKDWLAALSQHLLSHYPGAKFLYQRPTVVLVLLNASKSWDKDDEDFFAALHPSLYKSTN